MRTPPPPVPRVEHGQLRPASDRRLSARSGLPTLYAGARLRSPRRRRPAPETHGQRRLQRLARPSPAHTHGRAHTGGGRRPPAGVRSTSGPHRLQGTEPPVGGQYPMDSLRWTVDEGGGVDKWGGMHRRRGHRPTGLSTPWGRSGSRIGSGRAVGLRGGTWLRRGGLRRRRLGVGMSGWRGTCRRLRPGIGSPPIKMLPARMGLRDEVRRGGRPRSDTGWRAYRLKARGGRTWASIARELGLSDARRGDVAMRMAKRYAKHEELPWPI